MKIKPPSYDTAKGAAMNQRGVACGNGGLEVRR